MIGLLHGPRDEAMLQARLFNTSHSSPACRSFFCRRCPFPIAYTLRLGFMAGHLCKRAQTLVPVVSGPGLPAMLALCC